MRTTTVLRSALTAFAIAAMSWPGACFGQQNRPTGAAPGAPAAPGVIGEGAIRIRLIQAAGKRGLVRTPEYGARVNLPRGQSVAREWGQILVEFETTPEWIDELTVNFYALTLKDERGRRVYSMYKTTVVYIDVAAGRGHYAAAYLRPTAIQRYGDVVGVAAEFSVGGKVLAEMGDDAVKLPENWWRNPLVTDSKDVIQRGGYLQERSLTPFAFVNIDDFEAVK